MKALKAAFEAGNPRVTVNLVSGRKSICTGGNAFRIAIAPVLGFNPLKFGSALYQKSATGCTATSG